MTEEQLLQESLIDDKKINILQKQLKRAYYWKRASWRALWPFAYTSCDESRLVGVAYLIGYPILFLILSHIFGSSTVGFIVFVIIYVVKIPLMMHLVNSRINKLCMELSNYEKKYIAIRDDYIRDVCQKYDILKTAEGYQHQYGRFVTLLRSHASHMSVCAPLDDFYGNIKIYPIVNGDDKEMALRRELESGDTEPAVNNKIAALDFTKGYTVHTNLNNMNSCMAYLSPNVMLNYANNRTVSDEVLVYTISGNRIEALLKGTFKNNVFDRSIHFSFSFKDPYEGLTEEEWNWNRQIDMEEFEESQKPAILRKRKKDKKKKIEGVEIYRRYFKELVEVMPQIAKEWDFGFTLKEE